MNVADKTPVAILQAKGYVELATGKTADGTLGGGTVNGGVTLNRRRRYFIYNRVELLGCCGLSSRKSTCVVCPKIKENWTETTEKYNTIRVNCEI